MEHDHDHNDHNACCSSNNNIGVRQSLTEMDFERGIWYAAQYNDLDRVRKLLKKDVSLANAEDTGYTALHYAARNGHYDVCKVLIENGAEVNAQTRCGHATALHRAAMQGHVDVVEFLLKSGANPNLKDADGYIALHKALMAHSTPVCKHLIPCTDLTVLTKNNCSIEQFAEEHCADILSFLSTHIVSEEKVKDNEHN